VRDNEVANEKCIIEAINLGDFYRYVNKRITNRTDVGVIVNEHGVPVTDKLKKTNILIVTLRQRVYPIIMLLHSVTKLFWSVLDTVHICETDFLRSINKLKCNMNCDPDEVPPVLIKHLKHCLCKPLSIMFSQLVSVGIVPVFKKDTAGDVSNYRPISLTCVLGKVMERIIARKISNHQQL